MEKKIGIITLYYHNYNYGGLLQAYALVTCLNKKMDFHAEQIAYKPQKIKKSLGEIFDLVRGFSIVSLIGKLFIKLDILIKVMFKPQISNKFIERKRRCDEFRNMIPHSAEVDDNDLQKLNDYYDVFVTGSDQVWNPNTFRSAFFLDFVKETKTKVAYAASMAVNSLSAQQKRKIFPLVSRLDFISVREKKAMDILSGNIPEKEVRMVLDPVFLLYRNEWDLIVKSPLKEKKYIYTYFLGERKFNINLAKRIAEQLQIPIATVPYIYRRYNGYDHNFGEIEIYDTGPDEFVGLIKDAQIVLTDSFHAVVFSIIYHKNFWVFDRDRENDINSMNSRLTFLLEEFGLSDRRITRKEQLNMDFKRPIRYNEVEYLLEKKRKCSLEYLFKAVSFERNKI